MLRRLRRIPSERRLPPLVIAGWAAVLVGGLVAGVAAFTHPGDGASLGIAATQSPTAGWLSPAVSITPSTSRDAPPAAPQTPSTAGTIGPHLARSTPVRVRMPAIGVDSSLMQLGLQKDGSLEVPPTGFPAGWFTGGPTPGELGPAVIAGHVDWNGRPGVFYDLRSTRVGDEVDVVRNDGTVAAFRVTRVAQYAKDAFPTALVYGNVNHAALRLITCGGQFDRTARSYTDNIVVFADLITSRAA